MHYAGLSKALRGAHAPNLDPGVDGIVLRRPLGVVGAIVPWNFPTTLLSNKLAPALVCRQHGGRQAGRHDAADHAALRRAAARGRAAARRVQRRHRAAAPIAGKALVTHPRVRKIAFTGSTPAGEQIMALAAKGTKRVTLELGGSDPMIICDDADLAAAASAASMGRFYNCGQACLAIKRVYVFDVGRRRGDRGDRRQGGAAEGRPRRRRGLQMGPLHTARQRDEVAGPGRATLALGGTLATGGGRPTTPSSPTASSTTRPSSSTRRTTRRWRPRRSSAPRCRSGACATSTRRSSAPTPRSSASAPPSGRATSTAPRQAAERIEAGYTWVNSRTKVYDELPFGGWKSSGYGKEHGEEAFDYYTDLKAVVVRRGEG